MGVYEPIWNASFTCFSDQSETDEKKDFKEICNSKTT